MTWNVDHLGREGRPRARPANAVRREEGSITAVDRIPRDRCIICDEVVDLYTDGTGRLVAFDRWPKEVHRHPEATMGEGTYRRLHGLPDGANREPSEAEVQEILTSTMGASQLARAMGLSYHVVVDVLNGRVCYQQGVDYEEIRQRRAGKRGKVGSTQDTVTLTEEQVRDVIYSSRPNIRLVREYNISQTIIHEIRRGLRNRIDGIDYDAAKRIREQGRKTRRDTRTGQYRSEREE